MPVAIRKLANPRLSRTSVSSRNRIQRLKYDTIMGGQQKKNYNK